MKRVIAQALACALSLIWAANSGAQDILQRWDFNDPAFRTAGEYGCTTTVENGLLVGKVPPGGPGFYFFLPEANLAAPMTLRMRLRTADGLLGQGEAYWRTAESPGWAMNKFIRFDIIHDGDWHEYVLPLPVVGTLTQLRLGFGSTGGRFDVDWIALEAAPYPASVTDAMNRLPQSLRIEDGALQVELRPHEHLYTIRDKRTGRAWTADGAEGKALLIGARNEGPKRLTLDLWDPSERTKATCVVALPEEGVLAFEASAPTPERPFYGLNEYPPALRSDLDSGKLFFCDRSCGVYIDQTDKTYGDRMLWVYGNTQTSNMPWVGLADALRGDGVMTLVETPADAMFHLQPDAKGRCWPQVHWETALNGFAYPRGLSYRFAAEGGYVHLARMYRDYAAETGKLVTLETKAKHKPAVDLLPGAPIIWGGSDVRQFVREARTEGVLHGVLSNAHHGLDGPPDLSDLNDLGYVTSEYDNFSDALDGRTGKASDPIQETAIHARPGMGPMGGWVDEQHSYFTRSSAFALRALKSYVPEAIGLHHFNGRFVDVSMASGLNEDYHPGHTFDRRQDMAHRRDAIAWLGGLGLVLGTEHGNDWGIDLVEYTEGSLGGPFWWTHNLPEGWSPGHLRRAKNRTDYDGDYLKYGIGFDTRIPLWQLVYHDCAISTQYWGDGPGFHYAAAPELSDRQDLFAILYGGIPLLWRDWRGYDWHRNRNRWLQSYHDTSPWHEAVAFSELVDHEFLTADSSLQRTRFGSGHVAVVNFGTQPQRYEPTSGTTVTIAPGGFYAEGPGIIHERLQIGGETVSRTESKGYRRYESESPRQMGPVHLSGQFLSFQVSDDRWQMVLQSGHDYRIDVANLTGIAPDSDYALARLDADGEVMNATSVAKARQALLISPNERERFYGLLFQPSPQVFIYPVKTWMDVDDLVTLSTTVAGASLRYTLDGTEPVSASALYEAPFRLPASATVRARAFVDGVSIGASAQRALNVTRTLYRSGIITGGDAPVRLSVDVKGMDRLRLLITEAGDDHWSDWAGFAEPQLIDAQGRRVPLTDLTPDYVHQTIGAPNVKDGEITFSARKYKGVACRGRVELVYALDGRYERFESLIGVDDRGNPGALVKDPALWGTVEFAVQGVVGSLKESGAQ